MRRRPAASSRARSRSRAPPAGASARERVPSWPADRRSRETAKERVSVTHSRSRRRANAAPASEPRQRARGVRTSRVPPLARRSRCSGPWPRSTSTRSAEASAGNSPSCTPPTETAAVSGPSLEPGAARDRVRVPVAFTARVTASSGEPRESEQWLNPPPSARAQPPPRHGPASSWTNGPAAPGSAKATSRAIDGGIGPLLGDPDGASIAALEGVADGGAVQSSRLVVEGRGAPPRPRHAVGAPTLEGPLPRRGARGRVRDEVVLELPKAGQPRERASGDEAHRGVVVLQQLLQERCGITNARAQSR